MRPTGTPGGPPFRASFAVRSRDEAAELAVRLGEYFPEPGRAVLGLQELLFNAIEHGNLAIGTAHKTALLRAGRFLDEIGARMGDPRYRERRVSIDLVVHGRDVEVTITDEGGGFDAAAALARGLEASDAPNGRGIALTRATAFPTLTYRGCGNIAVVTARWP